MDYPSNIHLTVVTFVTNDVSDKCYFCSDAGELYAKKLANFVEKRLKHEKTASVRISLFFHAVIDD